MDQTDNSLGSDANVNANVNEFEMAKLSLYSFILNVLQYNNVNQTQTQSLWEQHHHTNTSAGVSGTVGTGGKMIQSC